MKQSSIVSKSFGSAASDYLTSTVHATGADLQKLATLVQAKPNSKILDLGCGAGHVSYAVAPFAKEVIAYDLTAEMLATVAEAASQKGIPNITTVQGNAESLPFVEEEFDFVISRYSAHHWLEIGTALKEVTRVLKREGNALFIDICGEENPLYDTHMQAVELLRDSSHIRDYAEQEWLRLWQRCGLEAHVLDVWSVPLEFQSWVKRIGTPEHRIAAIRTLWNEAPEEVRAYFHVQTDYSFTLRALMLEAKRNPFSV